MCSSCNFRHIYHFESETAWKEFNLNFTKYYINELILIAQNHRPPENISSYDLYKCKTCGEKWACSYPENAWRGFFLPENLAMSHRNKRKQANRSKGIIVLSIVVFILIVIIRGCVTFISTIQ